MSNVADLRVIVTGGARGIGSGIVQVLAQAGARVLIIDIDEKAAADQAARLRRAGLEVLFHGADVARRSGCESMAGAANAQLGGLDVLCANAGVFPSARLETMSEADWDRVHDVNLRGMFLSVQTCLPLLRASTCGRIVLTSSITGPITGYAGWSHYGASKAGMLGFMRSAALELAPHKVTINAVMPGNIATEGLTGIGQEYLRQMESAIPLHRLGSPEDIGHAVRFFASREAAYITGQTLVIDGGQVLPESLQAMA